MKDRLINKVISKIKKEPYKIDDEIKYSTLLTIIRDKVFMVFRGIRHKFLLRESKGILFVGKKVKIREHKKLE